MSSQRLVDYLILVGPSTNVTGSQRHDSVPGSPVSPTSPSEDWNHIFKPVPAILRRYPAQDREDNPLSNDIICFCQPEGCFYEINEASTHVFMLTHTETNEHTYGTCITFPYLVDPVARAQSPNWNYENRESVSIQEWGVLTVCLLSGHQFFGLFERCLRTLVHFIEHFGGDKLSWDLLIHSQFVHPTDSPSSEHYVLVREVERWIDRLTSLPAPKQGVEVLEIELEVDPASTIGYPPSTRLPVVDFPIHTLFLKLDVNLIIDTYRLLLTEQKVIIHSSSFSLSSQFVLMLQCLLYPLQYLFPIIPLLPTNMPKAENLLMVPTPFLAGVCSSFLSKLAEVHHAEIWLVDLDKFEISPPTQVMDPPNFPISVLQLQADIRLALDRIDGGTQHHPRPYVDHMNLDGSSLKDEVDVLIRIAFVEFLMGPDMIGHVENHITVYRLFPRPVVALRKNSFMNAYVTDSSDDDTTFINSFIQSQSLEYFLEWILNPTNTAFEEIKRGFVELGRVGDKMHWWIQHSRPPSQQLTLYSADEEPLLYQEMLSHKASQAVFPTNDSAANSDDDDSEFEIVGHEYYEGGSEITSSEESRTGSRAGSSQVVAAEVIEITNKRFFRGSSSLKRDTTPPLRVMVDLEMMELPSSSANNARHGIVNMDNPCLPNSQQPLPPNQHHTHYANGAKSPSSLAAGDNDSVDSPSVPDDSPVRADLPNSGLVPTLDAKESFHTPGMSSSVSMPATLSDLIGRGISSSPENILEVRHVYTPTVFLTPRSSLPADFADSLVLDKAIPEAAQERSSQSPQYDDLPESYDGSLPRSMAGRRSVEFSSPRDLSEGVGDGSEVLYQFPPSVVRSVPWSAVSTLHEMEQHIKELVGRIGSGQGLPWPKPQYFKKIVSEEKSRVALLRRLELRLGIREQTEMLLSVHDEIKPVMVTKAVYRGVLELLKYLLVHIEADISRSLESPIFSVFLLFRLALCLCMDVKSRSQSLRVSSATRSRSPLTVRTPSPDPSSEIINLYTEPASPMTPVGKAPDKSGEMRERKSTGTASKPEETGVMKETSFNGDKSKEAPVSQESLSNNPEEETTESLAGVVVEDANGIDHSPASAHKDGTKSEDVPVGGDHTATPTSPSHTTSASPAHTTPIKRALRRVRTLTDIEVGTSNEATLELVYLHTELFRGLGNNVKEMMCRKSFWMALFASVVTADRRHLGWNENTVELYQRYNSLGRHHRTKFAYKEDILLSTILHNLLVFMLMVGVSPEDSMDMCHRLSARVRLATFEERLLQQTLEELEEADRNGTGVDIRDLAMMALYSETQPVVMFIVHHGIDVTAPVYKLQITDEVCILRRFPDDKITCRFWNMLIHNITCNDQRMTVSFSYKDKAGEYFHHFHSKQYTDLFVCFLNLKLIATRNLRTASTI